MEKNKDRNSSSIEHFLIKKIPVVRESETVRSVLSTLEKESNTYDSVEYVYVIDKRKEIIGEFPIQELFNNPKNTPIKKFVQRNVITVHPEATLAKIAHISLKHNLAQIPVVKSKKLLGVISSKKILSTINRELREDIFHFAGIHKSHLDFENSLEIPVFKVLKDRLFWLLIGLFGAMIMALYISLFEKTLATYLIIASFVPATVYISDALGTQIQTIFVRDLAILGKEMNLKRYLSRQMTIASMIACILGILIFFFISLFWKTPLLAFVISLATFLSLIITAFTSLLIILLIKSFRVDPALGSGPIATIISDMTSVVIYFTVIVWLL